MSLSEPPQLQELSRPDKLELANELWLSAMTDDADISLHDRQLLGQRWADYQAGKIKTVSRAELSRRLGEVP